MVVARKNVRDFRNVVINPRDHFVLPDKRRLSRNDVSELLSNQQFWVDNPHMRSLIPQLLEYMVSPYNGKPTVAKKKVRGGGLYEDFWKLHGFDLVDDDEPMGDANPAPLATDHLKPYPTPLQLLHGQPHARQSRAPEPPKGRHPPLIAASCRICHLVHGT